MTAVPHEQDPIVQRLRLQYSRLGRMRFVSHRDFQRSLERAVRRADVPIAYSQGFSPHPKISYANAAPTGAESHAEYVEIGLRRRCDPDAVRDALDAALPDGLRIVAVVPADDTKLAAVLTASVWELRLPGVTLEQAVEAVDRFLALDSAIVVRTTKKGRRELDARAAIVSMSVEDSVVPPASRSAETGDHGSPVAARACAILRLVVRHGTPNVRPDDILAALGDQAGLRVDHGATMHRLSQGPLNSADGTVGDPLAPQRDAELAGAAESAIS